jgi:hypothetical protein
MLPQIYTRPFTSWKISHNPSLLIQTFRHDLPLLIKNYKTIHMDSPLPSPHSLFRMHTFWTFKANSTNKALPLKPLLPSIWLPGSCHCLPISSLTSHKYPPLLPSLTPTRPLHSTLPSKTLVTLIPHPNPPSLLPLLPPN